MATTKRIIAMSAPVEIMAAEMEGEKKSPPKFNVLAYTGGILPGALRSDDGGDDVILDLSGMQTGKSLVANLDHQSSQRVGNVNAIGNDGKQLHLAGIASAATASRDEVVGSAVDGFVWQASIEANPTKLEAVKPGATIEVNGQSFTAPPRGGRVLYVARTSTLNGFAFVSHGADDNTTVTIAASAASTKEKAMKTEVKAWAESMGIDVDNATPEVQATIEANYNGKNAKPAKKIEASNPFEARKLEAKRREELRVIADKFIERRDGDLEYIEAVEKMYDHAIEAKMSSQEFRTEMWETTTPMATTVPAPRDRSRSLNGGVIEAAICQATRLKGHEELFDDQTLQAAHTQFKGNIGLKQMFLICARSNGYDDHFSQDVTRDVLRAAFGKSESRQIRGSASTIDIATILSNTANKYLREGWNSVDQTALRLAPIRNVRDFKTITTVSLTDSAIYEQVGPTGEIKHGTLGEISYSNKADTYGRMLAITRQDIINDDLGALSSVPRKLGNGAMKKLNDIFWRAFLLGVSTNFFGTTNKNINEAAADMTDAGLAATEVIFMNQTNPDGTPLGVMPAILLVPTALKSKAHKMMASEKMIDGTATAAQGDANVWRGRFRVESSPYISNAAYTGTTSVGYWMLAEPTELPVIEIAALNGRVEPTVDTAEADFNTLGVQMRGYSDVGVALQEFRGGVYADGAAS